MTWQTGKCEFYGEVCQYCGVNDRNYCKEKEMTESTEFKITRPVFIIQSQCADNIGQRINPNSTSTNINSGD